MRVHCIGIGGIGLSALAQFCQERGDEISGTDCDLQREIIPILLSKKISVTTHENSCLWDDEAGKIDLILYSEAIDKNHSELIQARKLGINCQTYFAYLGEISREFYTIAVAGTHGKTTTTGLIASGFQATNFLATIICGARTKSLNNGNFFPGKNNFLLVEACEYRRNFRFLQPQIVILTRINFDHPDSFVDEEDYQQAFVELLNGVQIVIAHQDDKKALKIIAKAKVPKVFLIEKISQENLSLKINGNYNQENAQLAMKLAEILPTISDKLSPNYTKDFSQENFKKGLENYQGATRRQEFLQTIKGVNFYSDYAHHPVEISATIEGFSTAFPEKKIAVIFEPHQLSRTIKFTDEIIDALQKADFVGLFPIYQARDTKKDAEEMSIEIFLGKFPEKILKQIKIIKNNNDVNNFLQQFSPDYCIFMGAGRIDDFAKNYLQKQQ